MSRLGVCHISYMPTVRRRLLALLPKLGLNVQDLGPGTVLLSRSNGHQVTDVGSTAWLVSSGLNKVAQQEAGSIATVARAEGWKTVPLAPGAQLLTREEHVAANMPELQKSASNYLAAQHVAWLLRHYRVNCVFDVGANTGQYAKQLRRAGYSGRIASFEPVPDTAETLRQAAADDPDWFVYPYALGREDTTTSMNVVYGTMSSLLDPSEFGSTRYKRFKNTRTQEIEVRRLDGLMDEILDGLDKPRPYLKLDTQGYDLEAFAGLGGRAKELVGMQSEVALMQIYEGMPRMQEAIDTYEAAGFEITGMFPVTREEATGRVLEFDCVLARAEAAPES